MTQQHRRITFAVGDELPQVVKELTQEQVVRYADASGDHNQLHLDESFAATTQFGGRIAHGMLVLAFVSEMLTGAFGSDWLTSGRLKIRFRAPARPGGSLRVTGRVTKMDGSRIVSEIACLDSAGEVLISGEAEVSVA